MFCRVNMKIQNSGQTREVWFVFETAHQRMSELHEELTRAGSLCGTRYETARSGDHRRVVRDAFECIIMRENIVSIMDMQDDLYDDDGTALWTIEGGDMTAQPAAG